MKKRFDKQITGIILGFILPIVNIYVYYSVYSFRFANSSFFEFLKLTYDIDGLGKLLSISVLPNLVVFLIALKIEYLWVVKGIIIPTFVYGVAAAILALMV